MVKKYNTLWKVWDEPAAGVPVPVLPVSLQRRLRIAAQRTVAFTLWLPRLALFEPITQDDAAVYSEDFTAAPPFSPRMLLAAWQCYSCVQAPRSCFQD